MLELFVALGVVMGGLALLKAGLVELQVRQAQTWPTVEGEVIESRRSVETVGNSQVVGRSKVVAARIRYRYSAGGRSHVGKRVCIGGEFFSTFPERAERLLARYPEGSTVTVHHHPRRPAIACLEPRAEVSSFYAMIGVGVLLMVWFFATR